jgi:hypothetical protein
MLVHVGHRPSGDLGVERRELARVWTIDADTTQLDYV